MGEGYSFLRGQSRKEKNNLIPREEPQDSIRLISTRFLSILIYEEKDARTKDAASSPYLKSYYSGDQGRHERSTTE